MGSWFFDGVDDFITISPNAAQESPSTAVTLAGLIRPGTAGSGSGGWPVIHKAYSAGQSPFISYAFNRNTNRNTYRSSVTVNGTQTITGEFAVAALDAWYFFAVTWASGGAVTLRIWNAAGTLVTTQTSGTVSGTISYDSPSEPIILGRNSPSSQWWHGHMSAIGATNTVLSDTVLDTWRTTGDPGVTLSSFFLPFDTSTATDTDQGGTVNVTGAVYDANQSPPISQTHTATPNSLQVASNISQPIVTVEGVAQPNSLQVATNISQPTTFSDPGLHGSDIPHTYVESGHRLGPFCDANGSLYIFLEVNEITGQPFMLKSADGGNTWAEVDQAGRPTETDAETADIRLVDHVLHIGSQGYGSDDVRYFTFNTSSHPTNPDEWVLDELVASAPNPTEQSVSLEVRSDGTVVLGYTGLGPTTDHAKYKIRSSGGVWGSEVVIDSTDTTNHYSQITSVMDANELIHFIYYSDGAATIFTRTLSTGDVLETSRRTVTTGAETDGSGLKQPIIPPLTYEDGGNQVVKVAYMVTALTIWWREIVNAGTPSAAVQVSHLTVASNILGMNGRQPVMSLAYDPGVGEFHAFYANAGADNVPDATRTLYHRYTDGGSTWQTAEVFQNGGIDSHAVRSEVFTHSVTNGGKRVIGVYWDTGSAGLEGSRYDEFILPAVEGDATATPNHLQVAVNVSQPTISQLHIVQPSSLQSSVNVSEPVVTQQHIVAPDSLSVETQISQPTLTQLHIVAPNNLQVAVNVSQPITTTTDTVNPSSLQVATNISQLLLTQQHFITPNSLSVQVQISEPTTLATAFTVPNSLQVSVNASQPALAQQHFITPNGLQVAVQVSRPEIIATQHLPPVADLFIGNWVTDLGATTNLFEAINEPIPDPADFIVSDENNDPTPVTFRMQTADIPDVNTGHKIQLGAYKTSAGGMTFIPEWRSGYVSEASLGTLIYAGSPETLTEIEGVFTIDVPEINAADIPDADYTAGVTIRLVPTKG